MELQKEVGADTLPENVVPIQGQDDLAARASEDISFYIEGRNDVGRNNMGSLAARGYIAYWQAQSTATES